MAKTSTNLEENAGGLLCYVLTRITGIGFLVVEKENKFVRFHALQSTATFLPLIVPVWIVGLIAFLGGTIPWLIKILTLILWVLLTAKAFKGEKYKLPI